MTSRHPFNIQTKSGNRLWEYMNNYYGSSIWGPVGRGIEEIEAEMREIIKEENEQEN